MREMMRYVDMQLSEVDGPYYYAIIPCQTGTPLTSAPLRSGAESLERY